MGSAVAEPGAVKAAGAGAVTVPELALRWGMLPLEYGRVAGVGGMTGAVAGEGVGPPDEEANCLDVGSWGGC
jgi:hypothetical protein